MGTATLDAPVVLLLAPSPAERLARARDLLAAAYDLVAAVERERFDAAWALHAERGAVAASIPWMEAARLASVTALVGDASRAVVSLAYVEHQKEGAA